ncbi:MAG: hypothetical protein AB7U20_14365 [Planctomycetaceae bacterium]
MSVTVCQSVEGRQLVLSQVGRRDVTVVVDEADVVSGTCLFSDHTFDRQLGVKAEAALSHASPERRPAAGERAKHWQRTGGRGLQKHDRPPTEAGRRPPRHPPSEPLLPMDSDQWQTDWQLA